MRAFSLLNPGIGLMLLVAAYQSILSAIVKVVSAQITTGIQVLVYYSVPLLFLLPLFLCRRSDYRTTEFPMHFCRGIFSAGAVFCFFYASTLIPLSNAAVLFNTAPIFIPLLGKICLGESTSKQVMLGIAISLMGVIFIVHPQVGSLWTTGSLIGLMSGFLMAIAQIMLRYLTKKGEPVDRIVFYLYLISVLISVVIITIEYGVTQKAILAIHSQGSTVFLIGMLLALGLISLIAQRTLTKAFQYLPAAKLVPFLYISAPISSIIGWYMWQQPFSMSLLVGTFFILIGVLLITFDRTKSIKYTLQTVAYKSGV